MPTFICTRFTLSESVQFRRPGDHVLVGNDQFSCGPNRRWWWGACGCGNGAGYVADGDHVAHADGPFDEDYQAGDEIGEDFLQAEAQTQRSAAATSHWTVDQPNPTALQVKRMPKTVIRYRETVDTAYRTRHRRADAEQGHFQQTGDIFGGDNGCGQDKDRQAQVGENHSLGLLGGVGGGGAVERDDRFRHAGGGFPDFHAV